MRASIQLLVLLATIATLAQSVFTICVCVIVLAFEIREKFVIMCILGLASQLLLLFVDVSNLCTQHTYTRHTHLHVHLFCIKWTVKVFASEC